MNMPAVNSNEVIEVDVETYFAPAARASNKALQQDVEIISRNPVIDTVMDAVSGLVAVLNEHRQVLAINDTLLKTLEIDNADKVLGLRPGEAINCIHSHKHPGGCGTSKFCSTCGAVIAIVASLTNDRPEVGECVATVERNGEHVDLSFQVRCYPIVLKGQRFLLLFLQDTTIQQQQAALERAFFHDINNTIGALVLNSQMLVFQDDVGRAKVLAKRIKQLASQLGKEVEIQRSLSYNESHIYQVSPQAVSVAEILQEIQRTFANHPVSTGKTLCLPEPVPDIHLVTDTALLRRILTNMLVNAFEASEPGDKVKLWLEESGDSLTFCVWNRQVTPPDITLRVFQRNFSTKAESGRGLGTYTMKLFGETYLGGKVSFTTSEENGTIFCLCLPG
jgi:K+-sensing histidine kinase KdpD